MFAHRELLTALALTASSIAVAAGGAGCQRPPDTLANTCITEWPDRDASFTPAAPIADVTPAVLWRTRVTGVPVRDWLVLGRDQVAFTASSRLFILDRDGDYIGGAGSAGLESITTAAVDGDGNYYFAGLSAYSVAPDGSWNYITPLPRNEGRLPRARGRLLFGPDRGLFFAADDGHLYGVEADTGALRWRQRVTHDGESPPVLIGGVGEAVLGLSRAGVLRPGLWDRRTGTPMAWFRDTGEDDERYGVMIGRRLGIVTQRLEDRDGPYPWMHIAVLDECSEERWRLPATRPQWPALIGPDDDLFVVSRDDTPNSATSVTVYDAGGALRAGPVDMPPPWGIGADGTVYAVACDSPGNEGPSRLYAYTASLELDWMLPLGDACPSAGPVIDEHGQLYFTWYFDRVTEVVAVQTASPGLADTSWPVRRHDASGAAWLR